MGVMNTNPKHKPDAAKAYEALIREMRGMILVAEDAVAGIIGNLYTEDPAAAADEIAEIIESVLGEIECMWSDEGPF